MSGLRSNGFVLVLVLAVAIVLLLLGVTLHQFVVQQNTSLHNLTNAEVAHFLAEAGISSSLRTVREALTQAGVTGDGSHANPLASLLSKPQALPDTSLMSMLKDTWNADLKAFAAEVDQTASIRVEVWLRGFRQIETDPSSWADPAAKTGFLSIEATGEYRSMRRTLSVRRPVRVSSSLPPVICKFTLHARDAGAGQEGRFNQLLNDYDGINADGKPLILLNHATPESSLEKRDLAGILSDEKDDQVFLKRGWIWLGSGRTRLHLTSGPGDLGEVFHFYDVANPSTFQAVKFKRAQESLPVAFQSPVTLPWDRFEQPRQTPYAFGYSFILAGFHNDTGKGDHDAMYLDDILSSQEKSAYGARSSLLHLYGESRKGYQSRTKVFGRVYAAFPRYASLEITPQEPDVKDIFNGFRNPPPTYLLPSQAGSFDPARQIRDIQNRRVGGPVLPLGVLFQQADQYRTCMSAILELPYVTSYNSIQELVSPQGVRRFPPKTAILSEDLGQPLEIERDGSPVYKGSIDAPRITAVCLSRVQQEYPDVPTFWKAAFDQQSRTLRLNRIVRIRNPEKRDLILPPLDQQPPLKVSGGGMIVLDQGNVILRGVQMASPLEALTVVAPEASSVRIDAPTPNHVNLYAPQAQFSASSRLDVLGCVGIGSLDLKSRSPGGYFRFREAQDPSRSSYFHFAKSSIEDKDLTWHE